MTTTAEVDVYPIAVHVDEVFADPTYQRILDVVRARKMAGAWDRRLAGILEVSDRGEDASPRYAVIDGMHRWSAAKMLVTPPPLVANVHTGLTVAEEAELFDKLNRQRKQTGTWDHWKARRVAGDLQVLAIEDICARNKLRVGLQPGDNIVACVSSLEKVAKLGGVDLVHQTLSLIVELWAGRRDSLEAPLVHGLSMVLHYLHEPIDLVRLGDILLETQPRQLKSNAIALRDISSGSTATLTAIAIMTLYNKAPGRKILVSAETFTPAGARKQQRKAGANA